LFSTFALMAAVKKKSTVQNKKNKKKDILANTEADFFDSFH